MIPLDSGYADRSVDPTPHPGVSRTRGYLISVGVVVLLAGLWIALNDLYERERAQVATLRMQIAQIREDVRQAEQDAVLVQTWAGRWTEWEDAGLRLTPDRNRVARLLPQLIARYGLQNAQWSVLPPIPVPMEGDRGQGVSMPPMPGSERSGLTAIPITVSAMAVSDALFFALVEDLLRGLPGIGLLAELVLERGNRAVMGLDGVLSDPIALESHGSSLDRIGAVAGRFTVYWLTMAPQVETLSQTGSDGPVLNLGQPVPWAWAFDTRRHSPLGPGWFLSPSERTAVSDWTVGFLAAGLGEGWMDTPLDVTGLATTSDGIGSVWINGVAARAGDRGPFGAWQVLSVHSEDVWILVRHPDGARSLRLGLGERYDPRSDRILPKGRVLEVKPDVLNRRTP